MKEEQAIALTDVEWRLMQSLWRLREPALRPVGTMRLDIGRANHAVVCFLKRMAAKGCVALEGASPRRYCPLLNQETAPRKKTRAILSHICGDDLLLPVANAAQSAQLSQEDVRVNCQASISRLSNLRK